MISLRSSLDSEAHGLTLSLVVVPRCQPWPGLGPSRWHPLQRVEMPRRATRLQAHAPMQQLWGWQGFRFGPQL